MNDKKGKKKAQRRTFVSLPTGWVFDPDYLKHDSGAGHPESKERLSALVEHLQKKGLLDQLKSIQPHPASVEQIEAAHDSSYVKRVETMCGNGGGMLDPDTQVGSESHKAALMAAGGVMAAADAVMSKKIKNAFCAVRPPGHHAERGKAMGFCIFNNVAVGAKYVQKKWGLERVLIVDWDVHHGNGTQSIFWDDPSVFYFSTHQFPYYPGTGSENEVGGGEGEGFTFNMPMYAGSGDLEYVEAFENIFYPLAAKFAPNFIFISAGFDGHQDDPLASISLSESGFKKLTQVIVKLASESCEGRLVSVLEGGYNLKSLSISVEKHIRVLMGAK